MRRILLCIFLATGCPAPQAPGDRDGAAGAADLAEADGEDLGDDDGDGGASTFFCNMAACTAGQQFCYRVLAGARATTAAPAPAPPAPPAPDEDTPRGCNPIPPTCQPAQPAQTCQCLMQAVEGCPRLSLSCHKQGAGYHVFCTLP